MALLIVFSKIESHKSCSPLHLAKSTEPDGIIYFIFSSIHFSNVKSLRITELATSVSKLASSRPSPASARVNLVASTPNF